MKKQKATETPDFVPKSIQVYTEKDVFEHIPLGHPYRPKHSAILFIKKGRVTLKEQINFVELTDHSLILIDMRNVYEILEISDNIEIRSIAYDRAFIESITLKLNKLNLYNNLRKQFIHHFLLNDEDFSILWDNAGTIQRYLYHADRIKFSEKILENYFSILIYHISSIFPLSNEEHRNKMSRPQQIVFDFILLVSEHYLENKDMSFYVSKLGITIRYLSRIVKQETGKTPNGIIAEFLLNEAKAQLSDGSYSISEIAHKLQFSDQYAFSHFFKRHQNISPRQYRDQFK